MEYNFDLTGVRNIQEAHHCFFDQPMPHPSRNMPQHDFVYMLNGEWRIGLEKEVYPLRRNEVLLLPANLPHYAVGECTPKTHTLFFHISPSPGDRPQDSASPQAESSNDRLVLCNHIQTAGNPNIKLLFEKIIQTQNNPRMVTAYFHTLLYELKCMNPQKRPSDLARNIYDYIQGSGRLLNNQAIADYFHVSKRTAEIAFKSAYNTTIHNFVMESILRKAQLYMNDYPNMKMSSIAAALGFYDEFHFSKVFKSKLGMNPSEYKKTLGSGEAEPSDCGPNHSSALCGRIKA